jgi:hypothetical protein
VKKYCSLSTVVAEDRFEQSIWDYEPHVFPVTLLCHAERYREGGNRTPVIRFGARDSTIEILPAKNEDVLSTVPDAKNSLRSTGLNRGYGYKNKNAQLSCSTNLGGAATDGDEAGSVGRRWSGYKVTDNVDFLGEQGKRVRKVVA